MHSPANYALARPLIELHRACFAAGGKHTNLEQYLGRAHALQVEGRDIADNLERDDYPSECVQCHRTLNFVCDVEGGECNISGKSPAT